MERLDNGTAMEGVYTRESSAAALKSGDENIRDLNLVRLRKRKE